MEKDEVVGSWDPGESSRQTTTLKKVALSLFHPVLAVDGCGFGACGLRESSRVALGRMGTSAGWRGALQDRPGYEIRESRLRKFLCPEYIWCVRGLCAWWSGF